MESKKMVDGQQVELETIELGPEQITRVQEVLRLLTADDGPPSEDCGCGLCLIKTILMTVAVKNAPQMEEIAEFLRQDERTKLTETPQVWRDRIVRYFQGPVTKRLAETIAREQGLDPESVQLQVNLGGQITQKDDAPEVAGPFPVRVGRA